MVECGDGARFLTEPRQRALGPDQVGPQHLHGEPAVELAVQHLVHLGEAAGADACRAPRTAVPSAAASRSGTEPACGTVTVWVTVGWSSAITCARE